MRHPTGITPAKQRELARKSKLLKVAGWKGSPRSCWGTQAWCDPIRKTDRWVPIEIAWKRYERRLRLDERE